MKAIDIDPADLDTVRTILGRHAPDLEVRAFGSRVSHTARDTSDLDLVLMTVEPLDLDRMAGLRAAFTASDLPFRVDLVDWACTSGSFRRLIESDFIVICP
ncbi:nucleotidyltransferase family protein [Candidatus Palauibacter sp.]|uniref:nucleotidyltransferase family protein n=1 Tax=Candidatus Palauibacter sp. TaxID=3101350 RepID=UPI003B011144